MDGTIITANRNFLDAIGYTLAEIRGKHHSMFVEPAYRDSQDYKDFLAKLNRGEYQEGQFKRLGKGGREAWIQGAYNPIFDLNGKPFKIVKFATDITQQVTLPANLKTLIDENFAELEDGVRQSSSQVTSVTSAVAETSNDVQTVAASAEELSASINTSIDAVRGHVATTASAVEEQSAVTKNLSSTMQRTATSVDGIARNIGGIPATIQQAGTTVTKTKQAAQVLAR